MPGTLVHLSDNPRDAAGSPDSSNLNRISLPNSAGGIRISLVANQYIYGTSTPHGPGSVEAGT